ncbi:hypothetical protein OBRU01_04070 [Operophtera brumata]|uniref:Uncharacterized protein n=1 Tax=Operophtera brumata TaxID=104452 RepID=A0A0L7LBB0_OPEBR|nr:hypothetical protein OBRU01_04070 [Operophtera brumata]
MSTLALQHAHDAARHHNALQATQDSRDHAAEAARAAAENGGGEALAWSAPALAALLARVSSGSSTRCVSPVERRV